MTTEEQNILELERQFVELLRTIPRPASATVEMERVGDRLTNELKQHAKPIIDEVLKIGIRIGSVWDFVNTDDKYTEAIPILIKHLKKSYHPRIKEGIVRALAVKEAKGLANKAIMAEYHKAPKEREGFRWAFGNTMRVIVTKDDLDDLINIVRDESNGESRTGFIEALAKIKSPKAIEVLHELEKDKNQIVAEQAKKMLARKAKVQERKSKSN